MSKRIYNKIFVNNNQEEGSEKIHLGYGADTAEIVLYKDKETLFHVPFYTKPVALSNSSLIKDGAKSGLIPAASDRIFQSRKGYGNETIHGNSSEVPDGTWFCSWLYKDSKTGISMWMDRYFNSNLSLEFAEIKIQNEFLLKAPLNLDISSSVIYDTPSTVQLEPGVLYSYYHSAEETAQTIENSFDGNDKKNLLFKINNWKSLTATTSVSTQNINLITKDLNHVLFLNPSTSQFILSSSLSFDTFNSINCYLNWNPLIVPTNDFTLGGWIKPTNWNNCQSTQLFGNFTPKGGFGLFVDTLNTFPYFIIGETFYGHLMFFNQNVQGFVDLNLYNTSTENRIPIATAIDSNGYVYICTQNINRFINKLDNTGNIIATTDINLNLAPQEQIYNIFVDSDDNILLHTTSGIYKFSQQLIYLSFTSSPTTAGSANFSYDLTNNSYNLNVFDNTIDLIYYKTTKYDIKLDGNVYRNDSLFLTLNAASKLQIDPNDNLWILHGNNNVSVYDLNAAVDSVPLYTFTIGNDTPNGNRKISFIKKYDRSNNTSNWNSIIQYSLDYNIYVTTLEGILINTVDVRSFMNLKNIIFFDEDSTNFVFNLTKGDFTGYDYKRIFNKIKYNNYNQLIFKMTLKDKRFQNFDSYSTFNVTTQIQNWLPNVWKFITITYSEQTITIYFDDEKIVQSTHLPHYELVFDSQPAFFIGTPVGVSDGLNNEISSVTEIFNGSIGDINLYNYSIDPNYIPTFAEAKIVGENLLWSLPIPQVSEVEKIERFFKNKLPGSKANLYNITLAGTNITDSSTRNLIEKQIRKNIKEITPANSELVNIIWLS